MRESRLLEHIFAANATFGGRVVIPPGDDMGAVRIGDRVVLVTVDQVADGVHIRAEAMTPQQIGRKAMARSLSDVAAMAADPVAAVVAASLPRDYPADHAEQLCDAMRQFGDQYDCPIIGGDVSVWDHPLLLTVTLFAEPHGGVAPVLRSGAKAGDVICVTGRLGGAWRADGGGPHLSFEPRIRLAHDLTALPGVQLHSLIDLSDGMAADLGHICRMSTVRAVIDLDRLLLRDEARRAADLDGRPAWLHALSDGEDYELCFTLPLAAADALPDAIDGVPITRIGQILPPRKGDASLIDLRHPDGRVEPLTAGGWEHRS